MQNIDHWGPKDFQAFLLLHMAYADNELSMDELVHMAGKLGAERVVAMRQYIDSLSQDERTDLIGKKRKDFYPTEYGKNSLITHIHELCLADGDFSDMEKQLLSEIEKIL